MKKFLAFAAVMSVMALVACDDGASSNNPAGTSSTTGTSSATGNSSSSSTNTTGEKHACLSVVDGVNESCLYSADSIATDELCSSEADSGVVATAVTSCPSGATVTCENVAGLSMTLYLYAEEYAGTGETMCALMSIPE